MTATTIATVTGYSAYWIGQIARRYNTEGHDSLRVRVPEHVHLLFLPPYSPELQPVEHLWPLTNTTLVNRHFASIDELEDVQAARVVELRHRRDVVRSATLFSWWPERIHRRHGPHVRAAYEHRLPRLRRFCHVCR